MKKDETPGYDREKIEDSENGLTSTTVIEKNRDKNDVHENLSIGESGITPDEFQN
jgi:hypothetical protein